MGINHHFPLLYYFLLFVFYNQYLAPVFLLQIHFTMVITVLLAP